MDFSNAKNLIQQSIFPIFASSLENGAESMKGTGFFIDNHGLFASASHIFEKKNQKLSYYYKGIYPINELQHPQHINEVFRDDTKDLYFGKINNYYGPKLELIDFDLKVGTHICLGGYPNPNLVDSLTKISYHWICTSIYEIHNFVNKNYNFKGYLVDDLVIECMSGGPAFNFDGKVIGMILRTSKLKKKTVILGSKAIFEISNRISYKTTE